MNKESNKGIWSLLPIFIFLTLYLGTGILYEYILKIEMGFYNVPIVVAFLTAILVGCLQNRDISIDEKLEIMAKSVGDSTIVTMIFIFLVSGIFVGAVGRSSAESVAYCMLSIFPPRLAVAVLFIVACFVSTAMGTSCGTIALLAPIAVAVSETSGFPMPLCIASVLGGSMFGDNLSFISDTTIAACNTQGCAMRDKFKANFGIALPAALATLVVILISSSEASAGISVEQEYSLIQTIPYILVLICGIFGMNVFLVLLIGILSGSVIMLATGEATPVQLLGNMGTGASGMFETVIMAVLVAALCGIVRSNGGFDVLLRGTRKVFRGYKGAQLGMGLLCGVMDIATANNTVAIVMAGPIVRQMSGEYGILPKRSASILDTFGCVAQCYLPYGAQMLYAISAAAWMGHTVSAFDIIPYLYYPAFLLASSLIYIFCISGKRTRHKQSAGL